MPRPSVHSDLDSVTVASGRKGNVGFTSSKYTGSATPGAAVVASCVVSPMRTTRRESLSKALACGRARSDQRGCAEVRGGGGG